ncbi:hypothetical protein F4779DRAFT_636619 [Xylariaceae sp. FL0662B]|nr:hypothetical protein F4779DRAFT_636619 [Xylariaceae sp. FL0662B]
MNSFSVGRRHHVRQWDHDPMVYVHPDGDLLSRIFTKYADVEIQTDCLPYEPKRRTKNRGLFDDGIPDQVLSPDNSTWIDLGYWVMAIARGWTRTSWRQDDDTPFCKPTEVSFKDVMQYRIDAQSEYAEVTHNMVNWQRNAFESNNFHDRASSIICSLGLFPRGEIFAAVERLLDSSAVTIPWTEYCQHYLSLHPRTRNALWGTIQFRLAESIVDGEYVGCERLGYGNWETPIDRSSWSHEDFACRFILHLYDLMSNPELPIEHMSTIPDITGDWQLTRNHADRHFFGFSLLCLLTLSWQYKRRVQVEDVLVPAMMRFFSPQEFEYPKIQAGKLDLSPFSPWIYEDFSSERQGVRMIADYTVY